jgi:hypothetical protein
MRNWVTGSNVPFGQQETLTPTQGTPLPPLTAGESDEDYSTPYDEDEDDDNDMDPRIGASDED